MAANSGDIVQLLIEGGLAPQAATAIANAIANASSGTYSQGRDISDATPSEQLRLITADARRYQLTNLDFSPSAPFQDRLAANPGEYSGPPQDHPYKDSQPVTSAPPLSAPRVQGSDYVEVSNDVDGNSAVSRVVLRLRQQTGRHLRIDPSTKFLDALPFLASSQSGSFLSADFQETPNGTELVVSLRNLEKKSVVLSDGTKQDIWLFPDSAATATTSSTIEGLGGTTFTTGSWTPAFVNLGANSTQPVLTYNTTDTFGRYAKIGNLVTVQFRCKVSGVTSKGTAGRALGISGLPFASNVGFTAGSLGYAVDFASPSPQTLYTESGTDAFNLVHFASSSGVAWILAASLNPGCDIIATASYFTQ